MIILSQGVVERGVWGDEKWKRKSGAEQKEDADAKKLGFFLLGFGVGWFS